MVKGKELGGHGKVSVGWGEMEVLSNIEGGCEVPVKLLEVKKLWRGWPPEGDHS